MNDLTAPARFLIWIVTVIISMGLIGQLGKITYSMAETAIAAHEKVQTCTTCPLLKVF